MAAILLCDVLGVLCILLNAFVIIALIRNRRRVLVNVFYVMVLHCAIVDLIRGGSSSETSKTEASLYAMVVDLSKPSKPHWLISLLFGIGSIFSNFFDSAHSLMMLMIFVLCYVCLFTVLICYGKILRTIRQFQKCGGVGSRRILKNVGESREEETVALSSNNGRNLVRGSSIYHKSHATSQIRKLEQQKQQLLLEQYNQNRKKFSTISSAGSPQSIGSCVAAEQGDGGGCGQCHYCTLNNNNIEQSSRRCNSHRKWKSHLMSRHKYLIVIGTVLFVDVLFLFPYSGIQMVALLHLNNLLATSQMSTLIRWGLQILIGVHSVCQPLCYFRMKEFRRLACCLGVSRPRRYNGSGSSSNFAQNVVGVGGGGGTHSNRSARSIGSFKAATTVREDDCSTVLNPPKKKSIVLSTMFSENDSPPIGSANTTEETEKIKYEKDIPMNSSLVGERQMLLIAQRRKWTRNLSLLCKEEGEELQLRESLHCAQKMCCETVGHDQQSEDINVSKRMLDEKEASKINNSNQKNSNNKKRGGGMFLAVARILGIGWHTRQHKRERDKEQWNYNEEPTLLDSDWHRPGEVIKFRSKHKRAELRPRLSDLSGLRSNSVFTPINTSAGNSRHPSNQWIGLTRNK
uniref:G-protein coupled receptors family 1 profile domain-containing protein n=1 Tax=Meloidogyne javanica TaxID=6303 RepID=A0A915MSM4_MELJA